jgi:hypothetical protein
MRYRNRRQYLQLSLTCADAEDANIIRVIYSVRHIIFLDYFHKSPTVMFTVTWWKIIKFHPPSRSLCSREFLVTLRCQHLPFAAARHVWKRRRSKNTVEFSQIIAVQTRFIRRTVCCLANLQRREHVSKQIAHSVKNVGLLNDIQRPLFLYVWSNTEGRANNVETDNKLHWIRVTCLRWHLPHYMGA